MSALYARFLESVPLAGLLLDAGCGSGRDSKAFLAMGYRVCAFDASPALVEMAAALMGQPLSDAVAAAREVAIAEAVRIGRDRKALKAAEIVALIVAAAKHAAVSASGQNSAGGAGDESPERLASNRKLICAEREVGSLKLDSKGRVQINLLLPLPAIKSSLKRNVF